MIKEQMFIGAALIAGVAAGYFLRGDSAAPKAAEAASPAKVERRGRIADAGDAASNAALRKRVAELERLLAEREAQPVTAEAVTEEAVKAPEKADNRWRPPSLKNLKESDPARYAQITNRMAQHRQRQLRRAQGKLEFLESIDTSGMSAAAKRTHARLQELLAQREEMRTNPEDFESLTEEERRSRFEEMRELDRELRSVNAAERRNLFSETAKSLGLSGEDASALTSTIDQILDATDANGGHMRGEPPPGGNPPPQGGNPPPM